jgi:hypothetical protein
MVNFIICTFIEYYLRNQINTNEEGWGWSDFGGNDRYIITAFYWQYTMDDNLGGLDIILYLILKKQRGRRSNSVNCFKKSS